MSESNRIRDLEERLAIVVEMRDAICRQMDEILIRRNKRIDELESEVKGLKEYAAERNGWATELTMLRDEHLERIAELEEWIRNKRDSNFEFACKHLEGWTKGKDSFYAESTEILERK